jgi:cobalt/nickel transport system permease protein
MAAALGVVVGLVVSPVSWWVYGTVAAALLALALVGRVPARSLAWRMLLAEPFVIGVALLTLFQPDGGRVFAAVVTRSTLCVATVVLLGAVTPFGEMLGVMKRARVPGIMITTLTLMHRYLYVLVDEAGRMRTARASRTFGKGRRGGWGAVASVVSQLFLRASTRSERIYAAMCSRGWE